MEVEVLAVVLPVFKVVVLEVLLQEHKTLVVLGDMPLVQQQPIVNAVAAVVVIMGELQVPVKTIQAVAVLVTLILL